MRELRQSATYRVEGCEQCEGGETRTSKLAFDDGNELK